MEHIIIYGSQYGSSRRYAEKLSEQTGIPAVSYKDAPDLSGRSVVVYLGSLYAGRCPWPFENPAGLFPSRRAKADPRYRRAGRPLATGKTWTISAPLCESSFPNEAGLTGQRFSIYAAG